MNTEALKRLAIRVKRNSLDHRNPEAFYEEREEIADELFKIYREAALSGVETITDLLFVKTDIDHGVTMDEVRNPEGRG